MRRREASTGDPRSPLAHVVRTQRARRERSAFQNLAGWLVEVNTQFSLVESFGDDSIVECMGERERETEGFSL